MEQFPLNFEEEAGKKEPQSLEEYKESIREKDPIFFRAIEDVQAKNPGWGSFGILKLAEIRANAEREKNRPKRKPSMEDLENSVADPFKRS